MQILNNRQVLGIILITSTLLADAGRGAEAPEPIRIRVETKELHPVDPRLFGQFLERPSWGETGPEIATGTNGTLSADVVEMLRTMQIPIVRFPGGTDIDYLDWTDLLSNVPGRAPDRPVSTGHRGDPVTNRFGYDEYLRLAAELKWDSILVVNFLDGLAKRKPLAEAARHAAGLVAYANAPVGTKLPEGMPDWPAVRAKNGHPAPYGVKIFQLGNEWFSGLFPQEVKKALGSDKPEILAPWYRECVIAYADALHAVDPGIELIADGFEGFGVERLLLPDPEIRQRIRYVTFHFYAMGSMMETRKDGHVVPPTDQQPADVWRALTGMPGFYDAEGRCNAVFNDMEFARGLGYEISVTEWNWNGWGKPAIDLGPGVSWQHAAAIGSAGFLNGLLRNADSIRIATQSMLVGHKWDIAAIRVDPTGKVPTHYNAQGAATTFYNRHHGDRRLALQAEGVPTVPQPYSLMGVSPLPKLALLDLVATRHDKAVFIHAVNRAYDADLPAELDLTALAPPDGQAALHILEGVPEDQVATQKAWMTERTRTITVHNGKAQVTFPRRAIAIVEIQVPQ